MPGPLNPKENGAKGPLLSTAEIARWLGVSPRTICLWAECGEMPAIKVGRQWRFREEDVRRWLETPQRKTGSGRSVLGASAIVRSTA